MKQIKIVGAPWVLVYTNFNLTLSYSRSILVCVVPSWNNLVSTKSNKTLPQRGTTSADVLATVWHKHLPSPLFGAVVVDRYARRLCITHGIPFARWWHHYPSGWFTNRNMSNNFETVVCQMSFILRSEGWFGSSEARNGWPQHFDLGGPIRVSKLFQYGS